LSEIYFESLCGAWFFELDDTLHWISGLDDLGFPELEVVDMVSDDGVCNRGRIGASATADCYRCVLPSTFIRVMYSHVLPASPSSLSVSCTVDAREQKCPTAGAPTPVYGA